MEIEIIPYISEYQEDFKQLNIEWLQQYFVIEAYDEYQLSHPIEEIIDKGGHIFLAKDKGRNNRNSSPDERNGYLF